MLFAHNILIYMNPWLWHGPCSYFVIYAPTPLTEDTIWVFSLAYATSSAPI